MAKPYRAIFNEFQGGSFKPEDVDGSGDVKYHLGASSDREFDGNSVHLSLTANPSHLEAVNPVVLGKARAKQAHIERPTGRRSCRSCCMATRPLPGRAWWRNVSVCRACAGHRTGGTMHIVVNNQIGFTTAPHFSRSSPYPTDIALMVEAPIFHVNGDDPEAVVHAAKVATEFRQKFHKDVVIDIFCYRRFGHNEGDEPMFTNPAMYKKIKTHKTTLQLYTERLVKDGLIPEGEIEDMKAAFQAHLNEEFEAGKNFKPNKADWLDGRWSHLDREGEEYTARQDRDHQEAAGRDRRRADPRARRFRHPQDRRRASSTTRPDVQVRHRLRLGDGRGAGLRLAPDRGLPGAACRAGLHPRHVQPAPFRLHRPDDRGTATIPLNHIKAGQSRYEVIDSMLSEYAVLGFEYGYSLAEPNALVMWEAQFGDFANGAQIMFDQFISSGESKWLRMSGLVCLLPHGFEGRGRNTPRPGSNASCRCARRTTGSSRTARRRRTTSTSCADSCTGPSASRWC